MNTIIYLVPKWIKAFLITIWKFFYHFPNPVERHRYLYGKRWGWFLLSFTIIGVCIFTLWLFGFSLSGEELLGETDCGRKKAPVIWGIISQFADPGNIPMAKGGWASVIAVISAFAGVVCLSGLMVSSLINFITQRSEAWRKGHTFYNGIMGRFFFKNYVVVIGVNEQTAAIVRSSLQREDVKYVLIQTRRDVEKARMRMNLRLDETSEARIVYYHGERTSSDDIKRLRLEDAKEVYVLGEDMHYENEEDHDAFNMTCLEHISQYIKERDALAIEIKEKKDKRKKITEKFRKSKKKDFEWVQESGLSGLKCHVNLEYQSTFMAFKATHIYRNLNDDLIEFLPFNVHELWAKKVLVDNSAVIPTGKHGENKIQRYFPVDSYLEETPMGSKKYPTFINEDSTQSVHLIIVGMNQMGVALALQTALLVHLPNYTSHGRRTTITFIDYNAHKEAEFLMSRYSALFELCRYRFISAENDQIEYSEEELYDFWNPEDDHKWNDPLKNGRFSHIRENDENFMDVQWEFVEGNVASNKIRCYLSALTNDKKNRTCTIAVCFNNPQQSIATALYLPETVLRKALQILVYQQNSMDMIHMVATSEKEWKRYEKLKPFGMIEGCYMGGTFDNILAKFANLLYTDESKVLKPGDSLDDTWLYRAERLWEELGIVDKLANIDLVDSFPMKLRSVGISIDEAMNKQFPFKKMDAMIDAEHRRWLMERLTMGYRPVTVDELNDILNKDSIKNKLYYKNKSRAHLNICPLGKIKEWDEPTFRKNQDKRILDMLTTMLMWEQWAILRCLHTDSSSDSNIKSIVDDMDKVPSHSLWVARHTVTKAQWLALMGNLPQGNSHTGDDAPVVNISKNDVDDFLLMITKKTGLRLQLPTYDDWELANRESIKLNLSKMEGDVWQWTKTPKGDSSFLFCGQSKSFSDKKWKDKESYWLPHFKSEELGFRLFASYSFAPDEVFSSKRKYVLEDDYKHVIKELEESMVLINGQGDISDFRILSNPVSQRQWKAVMYLVSGKVVNPSKHRGDYFPVEFVSYENAQTFVEALSRITGRRYRLPRDKEWLCAAEQFKCDEKVLWESGMARTTRKIVRPQYQNAPDLYDMYGGVWEWCDERYWQSETTQDEIGRKVRTMRGGSWRFSEKDIKEEHKASGSYWLTDYKADDVGFRIVISEEEYKNDTGDNNSV